MLKSWFASEDDIASHNPGGSSRIVHTTPTGFTSPHDAILAQMRGQPHVEPADDGLLHGEVPVSRKEEQSIVPQSTPQNPTAEAGVMYDPYDGTPIGLLMTAPGPSDRVQQAENISPEGPLSSRIGDYGGKLEQWEHLSQVLDLQNELARMHLEMEGVGIGDGKGKAAGKGRGRGKGKGDASWERSRGDLNKTWKPQRQATTDTIVSDVNEGDEGVDVTGSEENEMKQAREERFATMAEQFEGRKEAVQAIMSKLDHLSKALTQFHTLQAPDLEFSKADSKQSSSIPDVIPSTRSKITPHASPNVPDIHRLRPILSSIPSSRGSLSSAPQAAFEPEALPMSLSRSKRTTYEGPIYVNEMEPGKQVHVMDSPDSMKGSVVLPP